MTEQHFIPIEGQSFFTFNEWVNRANIWLTDHPEYLDTQYATDLKGWQGHHFTAMCFDQKGRRMRCGGDFMLARDENTFPVWWVWPDQIAALIMADTLDEAKSAAQADYEARITDAIEYEMVEFVDEKPLTISDEGMEKVREFIESFHFTVNERSFYKDVSLQLHKPNSLLVRINNDSSKSWIFSDLEQRRKAALSALQREVE